MPSRSGSIRSRIDQVDAALQGQALPFDALGRGNHVVPLGGQPAREEVGDRSLVLDNKDLHGAMLAAGDLDQPGDQLDVLDQPGGTEILVADPQPGPLAHPQGPLRVREQGRDLGGEAG